MPLPRAPPGVRKRTARPTGRAPLNAPLQAAQRAGGAGGGATGAPAALKIAGAGRFAGFRGECSPGVRPGSQFAGVGGRVGFAPRAPRGYEQPLRRVGAGLAPGPRSCGGGGTRRARQGPAHGAGLCREKQPPVSVVVARPPLAAAPSPRPARPAQRPTPTPLWLGYGAARRCGGGCGAWPRGASLAVRPRVAWFCVPLSDLCFR